jgi:hypothetical protein
VLASLGMLLVALLSVVLLAKSLGPALEAGVQTAGAPLALVGVIIAAIVLLPETTADREEPVRSRSKLPLPNFFRANISAPMGARAVSLFLRQVEIAEVLCDWHGLRLGPQQRWCVRV